MPSYRTHSIHTELLLPIMDKSIEIKPEDMKSFAMGPDTLIGFDYNVFSYQHENNTKEFFIHLLNYIKKIGF